MTTMSTEVQEPLKRYADYLLPRSTEILQVKDGTVIFKGTVYRHEKLLPYNDSSVEVREYDDRVAIGTADYIWIVELYKDISGGQKA